MTTSDLPYRGVVYWPVGTGDSATIVVDDAHVIQVDLHDLEKADDDDATVSAVVDCLVDQLPQVDGEPYLSVFILTHADKDHCKGFADLLERVVIGEIWATPRLWREYGDEGEEGLCEDAQAFHEEAERRVDATLKAVKAGEMPELGDRVRIVGYDLDQADHAYCDLPDEYRSGPGHVVDLLDGEDLSDKVEVFIHAPFRDDCAAARNETSLAIQVTLLDPSGAAGKFLFFGDLAYETLKKIFEYSEVHDRADRIAWDVLLAPHHCSKKAMYSTADGKDELHQDILDLMTAHGGDEAIVVVSSGAFPASNSAGDNPPHVIARRRYEEIADAVICTGEYPDTATPQPVVFVVDADGVTLIDPTEVDDERGEAVGEAVVKAALVLAAGGIAAKLIKDWRARSRGTSPRGGLGQVAQAAEAARGQEASPQQPVRFG